MTIIGGILALLGLILTISASAAYKRDTGVNAPSRRTMAYLRRRARDLGISEQQAHDEWLERKQRTAERKANPPPPRRPRAVKPQTAGKPLFEVTPAGMKGDVMQFDFHCTACGGTILSTEDDEPTTMKSKVKCKACNAPLGMLGELHAKAQEAVVAMGMKPTGEKTFYKPDGSAIAER
jgi:hypothetical protein